MNSAIQRATVLLVEDQAPLRTLVRRILERNGFSVLTAASGWAALATLEQHGEEVNVLLSDVMMPGINGVALAKQVRLRFPHLRIVLMSGCIASELSRYGGDEWMENLVLKPFTPETLVAAVKRAA